MLSAITNKIYHPFEIKFTSDDPEGPVCGICLDGFKENKTALSHAGSNGEKHPLHSSCARSIVENYLKDIRRKKLECECKELLFDKESSSLAEKCFIKFSYEYVEQFKHCHLVVKEILSYLGSLPYRTGFLSGCITDIICKNWISSNEGTAGICLSSIVLSFLVTTIKTMLVAKFGQNAPLDREKLYFSVLTCTLIGWFAGFFTTDISIDTLI